MQMPSEYKLIEITDRYTRFDVRMYWAESLSVLEAYATALLDPGCGDESCISCNGEDKCTECKGNMLT